MADPVPPAAASGTAPEEHLVYQPLSLLAIAGFAAAALYAAVVLIGLLASILSGSPWLMPFWTLLFPLAGVVLSLAARLRIQRSEGTLAGVKLTSWGIALSVLFGLIYAAHTAAVYLVLRQQADAFAREFFDHLRQDRVEKAMRLTLPPANRPADGPNLRRELEERFNTGGREGSSRGFFSEFQQSEVVRSLLQGGEKADIKLTSVASWDYVLGGYQVKLAYRVVTPECTLDLVLPVHGATSASKEQPGRQWQVNWSEAALRKAAPTAHGTNLANLQSQAQAFFDSWLNALRSGRLDQVYLATVDLDRRKQVWESYQAQSQTLPAALLATAATGGLGTTSVLAEMQTWHDLTLQPWSQKFTRGELVRLDDRKFWSSDAERRGEWLPEVRKLFERPVEGLGRSMDRDRVRLLRWGRDGNRLQMYQDVHIVVRGQSLVDGIVVLECDAAAAESGPPVEWRVAGLELVRARPMPAAPGQRGPPRPGGP
jgi:hypothetical protein